MNARRRAFAAGRLDVHCLQGSQQIINDLLTIKGKSRCKATPETPARPLQNTLATHVAVPAVRAVEAVAVTFDGQTTVVVALDHHVDAIRTNAHLRNHPIATLGQLIVHLLLEAGFAQLAQITDLRSILGKRGFKVLNQAAAQTVHRAEVGQLDTAHQVHAIPCPRSGHVEALGYRVAAVGKAIAGRGHHAQEHDVALLALERAGIATADLELGNSLFTQLLGQHLHDLLRLLGAQQRDHADAASSDLRQGDQAANFLDDHLGFAKVELAFLLPVHHQQIHQRRVKTLSHQRQAQRFEFVVVELSLGVFDDRRHTAKMLAQHGAALGKYHFEQVIQRTLGRHQGPIQAHLIAQKARHHVLHALFFHADTIGRYLFVIAHHQHFFRPQQRRQCTEIRLRRFVDNHQVKGTVLRGQAFANAVMRHDPARDGRDRHIGRQSRILTITPGAYAGALADLADCGAVQLKGCPDTRRGVFRQPQPGSFDHRILIKTRQTQLQLTA